jgi:cytochrome c55X
MEQGRRAISFPVYCPDREYFRAPCMRHTATVLLVIVFTQGLASAGDVPDAARRDELLYLLKHDCGSCHGMTRKGGLGPALLPDSLRERPQDLLVSTVLDGRPGTPMPPWRGELSEQDARWLVEVLRKGEGL